MKNLIGPAALISLLALLSGCSILSPKGAQSCDTTSPAPSLLQRLRIPTVTMPWQRAETANPSDCVGCNAGVESSYATGSIVSPGVVSGGYVDGGIISSGPIVQSEGLYDADNVYSGAVISGGGSVIETRPMQYGQ